MVIKIVIISICAILWRLGGWNKAKWSGYRDVLVPIIIGGYFFFTLNWWVGILTIGTFQIIRMGYGAYDPENDSKPSFLAKITKDREGYIIRGLYGLITSVIGSCFVIFYTKKYILYLLYIIGNTILEVILTKKKSKDTIHELLVGAAKACIII